MIAHLQAIIFYFTKLKLLFINFLADKYHGKFQILVITLDTKNHKTC